MELTSDPPSTLVALATPSVSPAHSVILYGKGGLVYPKSWATDPSTERHYEYEHECHQLYKALKAKVDLVVQSTASVVTCICVVLI